MKKGALIFDVQKFSIHDGPGIRTIVFFKGCPMHCEWCANPESQVYCPELLVYPDKCISCGKCVEVCESGCYISGEDGTVVFDRTNCTSCGKCAEKCYAKAHILSGEYMTVDEIKEEVDKDIVFYKNSGGGITFSGGEALCMPEVVAELAKYYQEQDVNTAIETCGFAPWESFEQVLPYLDLVMFDLKIMDDEKHIKYTGESNKQILENLRNVCALVNTVIRIPIIPTINNSKEDIDAFGEFVSTLKDHVHMIHILPYHSYGLGKYKALGREYTLSDIEAPSDEQMEEIKQQLEGYGFTVQIGG
ncbi:MAG: glycyl-radical enzyme activating protein [Lachnospiraceae bacterium]|nr:glycyl-radical enzyme activating protein [Lachnospiraceae bacterium]